MKFVVYIVESERGWGSRVDEVLKFDTEDDARTYAREYNEKHNTSETVPEWYMRADYIGPAKEETCEKPS